MKLKALSHYGTDTTTRYGDCVLLFSENSLIVYDCGHEKHASAVESFLLSHKSLTCVDIVVSHNDSDHTSGVCALMEWLSERDYTVRVFTHQYLKHTDLIEEKVNDGRRKHDAIQKALLEEFDRIKQIIESAQDLGFEALEAISGTTVGNGMIVGPTVDEFTDVAAQAIDNRLGDMIGEGNASETVMNAASVQLKCMLDDGSNALLCGDATPDYLKNLNSYHLIQLPHHGQLDDAKAIFEKLYDPYSKSFLVSDNTGSSSTSGGSDDLRKYMNKEMYKPAYNTRDGVVDLPVSCSGGFRSNPQGVRLSGLDYQQR